MTLPGTRALAFASRWFHPHTVATVFEPLVADWQREWLDSARPARAWTWLRGAAAFGVAAVTASPQLVATKLSHDLRDGVVTWMFRFSVVAAAVLLIPVVQTGGPLWFKSARLLFSLPTMAALAIPFSVVGAVDVIRRPGTSAHVQRAAALKVAVVSAGLMLLIVGWLVPIANQGWSYVFTRATVPAPERSPRDLVLTELMVERSSAHPDEAAAVARAERVSREINERLSLVVLPLVLIWRRWRVLDLPTRRWFSGRHPALATIVVLFAYVSVRYIGRLSTAAWFLPLGLEAWTTVLLVALIGVARVRLALLWRTSDAGSEGQRCQ